MSDLKNLRPWKTAVLMGLFGFAAFGALTAQSRENAAVLAIIPLVAGVLVRRYSPDIRNTVVVGLMVVLGAFGLTTFLMQSKSTYLVSIAHKDVKSDQSYQARANELKQLLRIASDIAPLGSGQGASNLTNHNQVGGYSYFDSEGIDAEWGNMYIAFGVWGPLLLLWLYGLNARVVRSISKIDCPEARIIAVAGGFLLLFNLALTVAAVRIDKYETSLFTFQLLGVMSGWWLVYKEKSPGFKQVSGKFFEAA